MISNGQPQPRRERNPWLAMLQTGVAICGLAVVFGAIGAHAVGAYLNDSSGLSDEEVTRLTGAWQTASSYQMYHGFAIIMLAFTVRIRRCKLSIAAFAFFLLGILLFSGCLYWWVTNYEEVSISVKLVPIGGFCFIIGWLLFFLSLFELRRIDS